MKEDFLHFIWKYGHFSIQDLCTTEGKKLVIKSRGFHNHSNGPDFSNGSILIDDIEWLGHIEIHRQSSDWLAHKHQHDINFDNVVLHVVWNEDKPIINSAGVRIPCLELKERVNNSLLDTYENLLLQKSWIACGNQLPELDTYKVKLWLQSLAMEKLEYRAKEIFELAEELHYHWEQLFIIYLFRAFGLKQNKEAFDALAKKLPVELIHKYQHSPIKIEALLFGISGFLDNRKSIEAYHVQLTKEYHFLKHKHQLTEIPMTFWKLGRIRPANFPTLRLAQLSNLLYSSKHGFQFIIEASKQTIFKQLTEVTTSVFWETHYQFEKVSTKKIKKLGKSRIQLLLIHAIVPILFSYGKYRKDNFLTEKAIDIFESIPTESNTIITNWKSCGIRAKHALESQALLYLKKEFCDKYRCTSCQIGHQILSKNV
jgi:hypothetical protein